MFLPKIVPMDAAILRPIEPPDSESKLALNAQAHALVPKIRKYKSNYVGVAEENVDTINS